MPAEVGPGCAALPAATLVISRATSRRARRLGCVALLAVAPLAVALLAGCGDESTGALSAVDVPAAAARSARGGPVVEVVNAPAPAPPLDPTAAPTSALGRLRAAHLPVWSPELDWAFPPEVCGTDWALDAVAQPTSAADPRVLGDPVAAAALSVMRYEFVLSRSLAEPAASAQLCVAVATVGAVRDDALALLADHLATGTRAPEAPSYPAAVTVTAASPTAALAVACVPPGRPDADPTDGVQGDDPTDSVPSDGAASEVPVTAAAGGARDTGPTEGGLDAPARLAAYLLSLSVGLEDAVTDVSYRVAGVAGEPAGDCGSLDAWAQEWDRQARQWASEDRLWSSVGRTVTVGELCEAPPPDGPDECPRDWPS